mgnify:CR=1 FL=1
MVSGGAGAVGCWRGVWGGGLRVLGAGSVGELAGGRVVGGLLRGRGERVGLVALRRMGAADGYTEAIAISEPGRGTPSIRAGAHCLASGRLLLAVFPLDF